MATKKKAALKKASIVKRTAATVKKKAAAINKYNYPLNVATEIEFFLTQIRSIEYQNRDRLRRIYKKGKDDLIIGFEFIHFPGFYFAVENNYSQNKKVMFYTSSCPASRSDSGENSGFFTSIGILTLFGKWLDILDQYEEISLTDEERMDKAAEEDFFEYFDVTDEEANTYFDFEKQILIYRLLEYIEKSVEEHAAEKDIIEIKSEINQLKEGLQNETRRGTVKKLSRLFAKIKKKGIKLVMEIFKEGKKEIIKRIVSGGLDDAGKMISWLT